MPRLTTFLIDITRDTLSIEEKRVTETARFAEDLGADSLDCVELMMALEDRLGIEFSDDELPALTSVKAVADYLKSRAWDRPAVRSLLAA